MADLNTTSTLSPEVAVYYEKVFLARSQYELILKEGGQLRSLPNNEGKTVNFTRYEPLTINTTAIGEGCNPSLSNITACTVSVTLAEYGQSVQVSKFLILTGIDKNMAEKVELVGQNMGESLNRLVRNQLMSGTTFYGNDHAIDTIAAGDTLDACDCRLLTQKLELAHARPYKDGFWIGKTQPVSKYTLIGDTTWVNAKTYSDVKKLYSGETISPVFLKFGEGDKSLIPSEGGMNNIQLSILIGSLLGDGCLTKAKPKILERKGKKYFCKTDSYTYEEQHTEKQRDYLLWKAKMLFPYARVSICQRSFGKVYSLIIRPGRGINRIKQQLNYLHKIFYPNGKKALPKDLISFMNKLIFAVWFFDDGNISIKGNKSITLSRNNLKRVARLSTCAFTYKEQLKIARILHKKLSIQPAIYKDDGYYRMTFKSMNGMFDKVRDILDRVKEEYKIEGMDYKVPQRVETKWGTAHNSRRYSPN